MLYKLKRKLSFEAKKPERIPQTALSSLDEHKAKSRMSSWYLYWLVQYLLHYRNIPHLLS